MALFPQAQGEQAGGVSRAIDHGSFHAAADALVASFDASKRISLRLTHPVRVADSDQRPRW
jgi:hypothetical protein